MNNTSPKVTNKPQIKISGIQVARPEEFASMKFCCKGVHPKCLALLYGFGQTMPEAYADWDSKGKELGKTLDALKVPK